MGLFDLGDMFDFDGDGKTDAGEEFMAYMMFEEMQKEKAKDDVSTFIDDDDDVDLDQYVPPVKIPPRRVITNTPDPPVSKNEPEVKPEPEPEKPITLEEYRQTRKSLTHSIIGQIAFWLFLCLIPGGVIYASIATFDSSNNASWLVFLVFFGGGIAVFYYFAKSCFSSVAQDYRKMQDCRDRYERSLGEEEKEEERKSKRKSKWIVLGVIGAVILAVIVILSVNTSKTAAVYHDAEALIAAGEYDEAKTLLESIRDKGYHDTESLIALCQAHTEYNKGRGIDAYYTLKNVRFSFVTQEQRNEINSFRDTLQSEYDAYIRNQADRAQAEYEHTQSLPFPSVGQYVTKTQLDGMKWEGNDNHTFDFSTTVYLYVNDGNKYRLWISEFNCIKKVILITSHNSGSTSGRNGTSSFDTGPSVDGYSDPEDFYYWNWDDFVDYEDAEAYYYAHGGK